MVGISNADITGGVLEVANPVAQQAQTDLTNAILLLNAQTPCTTLTGDLGNRVLPTGIYCYSTSAELTNTLTLNGNATSVFIFQIGTTLTANPGSQVVLSGGALAGNVYWVVGTSATLSGLSFQGNVLASISRSFSNPGMSFNGRALASTGAVTLLNNLVTVPLP